MLPYIQIKNHNFNNTVYYIIPKIKFIGRYYISYKNVKTYVVNKIHPIFSRMWISTILPMSASNAKENDNYAFVMCNGHIARAHTNGLWI